MDYMAHNRHDMGCRCPTSKCEAPPQPELLRAQTARLFRKWGNIHLHPGQEYSCIPSWSVWGRKAQEGNSHSEGRKTLLCSVQSRRAKLCGNSCWIVRGEIPWNAGQSTSKAKRMLCLLRKGTHKQNKINKKCNRSKLQRFPQPYRQRIKSLTSFTTHHPSVTFPSVELPENELSYLLLHKLWV